MKSHWKTRIAIASMMVAVAMPAAAQGRAKGAEKKPEKPKPVVTEKTKPVVTTTSKGEVASTLKSGNRSAKANEVPKGPKRVTTSQAVVVTRDVLVANGYRVINVQPSGTTQVIYYRRGNMGNGRGLGPVQKIYVVPSGDVVRFTSVPDPLLGTILRRLGM